MSHPLIRVSTLTISDSRTHEDDESGRLLRRLLEGAGFVVSVHLLVPDDLERIRATVMDLAQREDVDAVVTSGGTGIAPRDCSIEAIAPLLDKRLDGFGEAFRRLSWEQVGARSVLSRALAGSRGRKFVVVLPGSPTAVQLAVEQLVVPLLEHATALLQGRTKHGPSSSC